MKPGLVPGFSEGIRIFCYTCGLFLCNCVTFTELFIEITDTNSIVGLINEKTTSTILTCNVVTGWVNLYRGKKVELVQLLILLKLITKNRYKIE